MLNLEFDLPIRLLRSSDAITLIITGFSDGRFCLLSTKTIRIFCLLLKRLEIWAVNKIQPRLAAFLLSSLMPNAKSFAINIVQFIVVDLVRFKVFRLLSEQLHKRWKSDLFVYHGMPGQRNVSNHSIAIFIFIISSNYIDLNLSYCTYAI